jgi:hypothetical protein
MKLLLIDSEVSDIPTFKASLQPDVVSLVCDGKTVASQILDLLSAVTVNDDLTLGFVFHNAGQRIVPFLRNGAPVDADDINYDTQESNNYLSPRLYDLLKSIRSKVKTLTIDLLSCKLNKKYKSLATCLNATVRYSLNATGSGKDGDWIMESDNTDVKTLYFTEAINKWSYTLISSNDVTGLAKSGGIKGIKYHAGSKTYKLKHNITWWNSNQADFYITLVDGETFDGNHHTITVYTDPLNDGYNYSYGLFYVSATTKAAKVKDLTVISSVNGSEGSGIVRSYSNLFEVKNCHHIGKMDEYRCGGIVGSYCTNFEVCDCSQVGDISAGQCGGIVGYSCGIEEIEEDGATVANNIKIKDCTYKGRITGYSGGITASYLGYAEIDEEVVTINTSVEIERCKAHIAPNSWQVGGICSSHLAYAGWDDDDNVGSVNTTVTIKDCLFIGQINNYGGGIVGPYAFTADLLNSYRPVCTATIEGCVSVADIYNGDGGGICGYAVNSENGYLTNPDCHVTVKECAHFGFINTYNAGGIVGSNAYNVDIKDCYNVGYIFSQSSGICGSVNGNVTITNCYASGDFDAGAYGINDGSATITNCYAKETSVTGVTSLDTLKGSLGGFSKKIWDKEHKSYPTLEAFEHKPWSHYKKFDDVPKLHV